MRRRPRGSSLAQFLRPYALVRELGPHGFTPAGWLLLLRPAILIQSANCETSDVRDYLQAGADGALDKGVSAALQTDVLARVYHDRFPDRSAGAAPKRARRE